jgi:hypothetical protein
VPGAGEDRGRDVIDWDDQSGQAKNARISTEVDRGQFLGLLREACRSI